ncbi:uncharacterized protein [Clytia hemisphaerica]|uniref:uncharacterized protein isoform X2 n=1 Tax=Clytia hemisphaerica TaxID=252671 RepID=UPI0034D475FC
MKQKEMEEQTNVIETDRDELIRENEYLKAVLSNRTEIHDSKLDEENRTLSERVKELEEKNTELVDEINNLYEDRQTLISSLLHLRSEEVDDVIKRSRNSSLASRDSSSDAERLRLLSEGVDNDVEAVLALDDDQVNEQCKKIVSELNAERHELKEAFLRVKKERDSTEKELDQCREDKDKLENHYADKIKECNDLAEERNEKNVTISELKLEKRTIQRQLDHMRENNRTIASKLESVEEENDDLRASLTAMGAQMATDNSQDEELIRVKEELEALKKQTDNPQNDELNRVKEELENTRFDYEKEITALQNSALEREQQLTELREQAEKGNLESGDVVKERDSLKKSLDDLKVQNEAESLEKERLSSESMKEKERLNTQLGELEKLVSNSLKEKDELNSKLDQVVSSTAKEKEEVRIKFDNLVASSSNEKRELSDQLEDTKNKLKQESTKSKKASEENSTLKQQMLQLTNDVEISNKQSKNRINSLEIEVTKGVAAKEAVDKLLRRKEQDVKSLKNEIENLRGQISQKEKDIQAECLSANQELMQSETRKYDVLKLENEKLLQKHRSLETDHQSIVSGKDLLTLKNQSLENELANCRNNFNTMKIENERLTKKIRQSERTAGENKDFQMENKRLKGANDALSQRVRVLESDENPTIVKARQEERERYSTLLSKHDLVSAQLKSITAENNTLKEKLRHQDGDHQHVEGVKRELSMAENTIERLNKEIESLKHSKIKTEMESTRKEQSNTDEIIAKLNTEIDTLKKGKLKMEQDIKYLVQSRKEEAEIVFTNKRTEIEHERDTIKAKYELLRAECDKAYKEKDHYIMTINTLRDENGKLHGQIRKQRLISNSTQDLMIQRLRDENHTLEKQLEVVQDSLTKTVAEKKELVSRLGKTDDSIVTNMRSLKARKNELQIRVNTLEREKEQLSRQLTECRENTGQVANSPKIKTRLAHLEMRETDLQGQLVSTHTKIGVLEADNGEFRKKLEESESLIYDLQQALSQANDLAMQKSLEATKIRKHLELKNDRLLHENTDLKRKVFFTGKSDGEISPTSLFPKSNTTHLQADTSNFKSRKVSLPASMHKKTALIRDKPSSSSVKDSRSFEYPPLDPIPSIGGGRRLNSSSSSSQVELDLSQQLRELLDLTNDLTKTDDEGAGAQSSDETLAPPVPPPPANYETVDRKKSYVEPKIHVSSTDDDDDKKQEDWV